MWTKTIQRPDLLPPEQGIVQARTITGSFAGKEVEVEFATARPAQANAPTTVRTGRLAPLDGSTYLLYDRSPQPVKIPFETTRRISHNNRGIGLLLGLGVGAVLGGLVGVLVGSSMGCDGGYNCPFNSKGARQIGVPGALVGGGVGAVIGTVVGYRTRFTF